MTVQDVSVISTDQFEAILAAQRAEPAPIDVAQPVEDVDTAPPVPQVEPAPVAPEPPEVTPDPVPTPPEPEVAAPVEDAPPVIEPPSEDVAIEAPQPSETPAPQQADRVAPEPVAQPEPDVTEDDTQQDAVTEDDQADVPAPEQDATAPAEATTEIVTEADEAGLAPASSARPPSRRPTPPVETAEAPEPESTPAAEPESTPEPEPEAPSSDNVADDIAAAVAEAQSTAPVGPPLTGGEVEGLRVAVSQCWNVGTLSSEAQDTTVTVFVAMNQDGTPQQDSIAMQSFSGGSEAAARRVFETARRAIIRCGGRGFPLPAEKYGQWQEIEMTFKPDGVFWR